MGLKDFVRKAITAQAKKSLGVDPDSPPGAHRAPEAEAAVTEWLKSPMEFGVEPFEVKWQSAKKGSVWGLGKSLIVDMVRYTMPDGATGRAFYHPNFTWSFLGPELESISDDDLYTAYFGWMFTGVARLGNIMEFGVTDPEADEKFVAFAKSHGHTDVTIGDHYRFTPSGAPVFDVWEFISMKDGKAYRGAGTVDAIIAFPEDTPILGLPPIYYFLGRAQNP